MNLAHQTSGNDRTTPAGLHSQVDVGAGEEATSQDVVVPADSVALGGDLQPSGGAGCPSWLPTWATPLQSAFSETSELFFPNPCAGCGGAGGPWCLDCDQQLAGLKPHLATTAGGHLVTSLSPYQGALRSAIVSYKERQRRPLARTLGKHLARSVAANCGFWQGTVILVPAPSRPWANRWRGWNHLLDVALWAARHLNESGPSCCTVWPVLATRWWAQDQQQLTDTQRRQNAHRAIYAKSGQLQAIKRYLPHRVLHDARRVRLIVVDDVVTSGATLDSCLTSLHGAGYKASSAAVICAARRD